MGRADLGRESVVFLQRLALGLVFAEGGEFFAAEDGEGVEDVGEFLAGEAVEVGDEGVEFGAGLGAVAVVAAVGLAVVETAGGDPGVVEVGVGFGEALAQGLFVGGAVGGGGGGQGLEGVGGKLREDFGPEIGVFFRRADQAQRPGDHRPEIRRVPGIAAAEARDGDSIDKMHVQMRCDLETNYEIAGERA